MMDSVFTSRDYPTACRSCGSVLRAIALLFGLIAPLFGSTALLFGPAALQAVAQAQDVTAAKAAAPAYASDPRFMAAMAEGKQLSVRKMYFFAADAYKKANKIARGQCQECLLVAYQAQVSDRNFKDAAAIAAVLESLAATPLMKSVAESRRGSAMLWQAGEKPKPAQLEAVHAVLQQAITDYPRKRSSSLHRWPSPGSPGQA